MKKRWTSEESQDLSLPLEESPEYQFLQNCDTHTPAINKELVGAATINRYFNSVKEYNPNRNPEIFIG